MLSVDQGNGQSLHRRGWAARSAIVDARTNRSGTSDATHISNTGTEAVEIKRHHARPRARRWECAMNSIQRKKLVEARADLILADEIASEAYLVHFEAQIHRSKLRKFFTASYVQFARTGVALFNVYPTGIWW
jgi:hypothetical protein